MATKKTTLQASDYVHLHNHTQYSLLDGLTKIPELMKHVQAQGMEALAITDHGTMSGAIEFYKEARSQKLKPIIGIETYIAARRFTDKEPGKDKPNFHLILLAMNQTGYQNLMALSTIANLEGYYYKPRIDRQLLQKHNEGLICLSGCASSEVGDALRQGQYDQAKEIAAWYKRAFGDRYYLEIADHGHPLHTSKWDEQETINTGLMKLAGELEIPCVVTCDAHYLNPGDRDAHEILLCVQTGSFLSDEKRMSLKEFELHVTDPKDIIKRWGKSHPEFITNTKAIAERCDLTIELGKILIPKFPVPKGETERSYLEKLLYRGLAFRYKNVSIAAAEKLSLTAIKKDLPAHVLERAEYELGIVDSMGFSGYFLIIADFINWGKNQGIVFGPGRGSAAGSIIAYALKITEIDPLAYDLLFERFLNPDRISMPDVDVDIQDSRRDEVIQYCLEKYGKDRVANILTFGRMAARNAVRDVSRVLQVPYIEADRLAKMIPPPNQGRHIPLKTSLQNDHDLRREYQTNETAKTVFDLAIQLEGTIRSHGVHAAGVVITPEDIVCYVPLEMAQKGVVATQYSMGPIDELGLLKIDFLGLSNLTIINNALRIVKRVYGTDININDIPIDDPKTFELFQHGDTTGIFQFESAGMKRYLKELKPTEFDDLIAMNALYRPGPMQFIDDYIARKHGKKKVVYEHPGLKAALENTYGVLVYQEQFMQISKDMCGFTGGQADTLRKAIGKKQRETMAKMKAAFIDGMIERSKVQRSFAEKFWARMEAFADYGFNKVHSTPYAMIAYQTAYLKAHYPSAFMAAVMTSDYDDTDRLAIEIAECKHMGMTVLPPDVNESFVEFAVVPGSDHIRFGMAAIKNVGTGAVEEILRARQDSNFESLVDFLARVNSRVVNRKAMESLIKAGAFDTFGDRFTLLHNLDLLVAYGARLQKQTDSGQTDIFGGELGPLTSRPRLELQAPPTPGDNHEQLLWERELLGLYLSQHPLELFEVILAEQTVPINVLKVEHDNRSVSVGGAINDIREITTKNGQKMAFVKLEDHYGEIEVILFPNSYQQTLGLWERDHVVLVRGKVNARDKAGNPTGDVKIIADDAREITPQQAQAYQPTGKKARVPKIRQKAADGETLGPAATPADPDITPTQERVYIRLQNTEDQQTLLSLKQTIDVHQGSTEVVLVLGEASGKQAIKLPGGIDASSEGLGKLAELVGSDNLVVR
ncbi:MAG TPA: DNA polymerase III subunit alpha [Candidatus Dormibacteraeota bacterium]|nr:DNA polymerase III subunit alpha [Candidatus Dormibacteraeota bacterium]